MLAIHGLTGHGQRWQELATKHLADLTVVAPDLLGHGRSSWAAPWTIEANVAALAAVLDDSAQASQEPVVVVAHSFGGAIALGLAAARPDLVSALVLLDPAVGLDGAWMHEIAESMFASPDYTDRAEVRTEKRHGSWADVDDAQLDTDLDEHLIALPNGRVGWRICLPAMMSYWSELARDIVLPPNGIATTVVRATHTAPPYVTGGFLEVLRARLGDALTLADVDCNHMVAQARPAESAQFVRAAMRP